jgi:Skp family chaperone for outer membrane proteins
MNATMKKLSVAAGLLAIGAGAAIGLTAYGANMMAGQPTVVVTVNLSQVMEKLNQRAAAETRLNKMRDELKTEQDRRLEQVKDFESKAKSLQDELDKAPDAAAKRAVEDRMQQLQEDAAHLSLENQAWVKVSSDRVDIEASLVMQDLYRSVKKAAEQIASANHYDVVLVDDSQGEMKTYPESRVTRVEQVRQQVASRRMLYVNPTIDITNDLISRMNNAYQAVGPKNP